MPQIFFPEWFGPKQIEAIHFQNGFHDKSAQTDCSKEMWIPILKGLKHLNTVLNFRSLALTVWEGRCFEDVEKKVYSLFNKSERYKKEINCI